MSQAIISNKYDNVETLFYKMKEEGLEPNVYHYTNLLNAFIKQENFEEAERLFETMKEKVKPNRVTYSVMINSFAKSGQLERAFALISEMKKEGYEPHIMIYTTIIKYLIKDGKFEQVERLYKELKNRIELDVIFFNNLIEGYIKHDRYEEAIQIFEEMKQLVSPNHITFTILMNAHIKQNEIQKAREIFDQLEQKDIVAYTSMISGYISEENIEEAIKLYQMMRRNNLKPTIVTYKILIEALKAEGNKSMANRLRKEMNELMDETPEWKAKLVPNRFSVTKELQRPKRVKEVRASVTRLIKENRMEDAEKVFDHVKQNKNYIPNMEIYSDFIGGYLKKDNFEKAIKHFNDFQNYKIENDELILDKFSEYFLKMDIEECIQKILWVHLFYPNLENKIVSTMAKAKCELPSIDQVLKKIQNFGVTIDGLVFNAIIQGLVHNPEAAQKWIRIMKEDFQIKPEAYHYSTLIGSFVTKFGSEEAIKLLDEMKQQNITPNIKCYTPLIKYYNMNNQNEKIINLMKEIFSF